MPIETIEHLGNKYPAFQASGNAARFVKEFAKEVCNGIGFDIGCNRLEWCLEGAIPIDPVINPEWNAYNLPKPKNVDYCFSSHMLEHIPNWVEALDYWHTRLKVGGVVFLYLPNMDKQSYWCGWHNRKHIHYFTPSIIKNYFETQPKMWSNVFVSETDLNSSFCAIAEKV